MRIVIYNSNTNEFDKNSFCIEQLPRCTNSYNNCPKKYTSSEITLTYQLPSNFLVDFSDEEIFENSENIKYHHLKGKTAEEIAE